MRHALITILLVAACTSALAHHNQQEIEPKSSDTPCMSALSQHNQQEIEPKSSDAPCSVDSALHDYSGNDLAGIEAIVEEVEQGSDSWRIEANQRIDQLRKAELVIKIVDKNGKPLPDIPVRVKLKRHQFLFGGVVNGRRMHVTDPDNKKYGIMGDQFKQILLDLDFNAAGFGLYLKYKQRHQSWEHLPALFEWFKSNDIPVRGHCLIWPGGDFMPDELSKLVYAPKKKKIKGKKKHVIRDDLTPEEKQNVRDLSKEIVEAGARKWPVFEWDVINETRTNHVIQDIVGRDVLVDWFKIARENTLNRDALLYLNENQVISDASKEEISPKILKFEDEVEYLLKNGAPISGLGFQSRFRTHVPPEVIYKRLCHFDRFELPIAATELEMHKTVGSELETATMTERVMTVYFSHKLVNGLYAWTIMPREARRKHFALVENDGRLNLRGKVWMYLMKNRWWTDETLTSDADGIVKLRGFKGDYTVAFGDDDAYSPLTLQLTEDRKLEVTPKTE